MRKLYVNRVYTNLVGTVSDTDRMKFASLAAVSPTGTTQLAGAFTNAIASAKSKADAAYQTHLGNATRRGGGRATRGRARGNHGRGRGS